MAVRMMCLIMGLSISMAAHAKAGEPLTATIRLCEDRCSSAYVKNGAREFGLILSSETARSEELCEALLFFFDIDANDVLGSFLINCPRNREMGIRSCGRVFGRDNLVSLLISMKDAEDAASRDGEMNVVNSAFVKEARFRVLEILSIDEASCEQSEGNAATFLANCIVALQRKGTSEEAELLLILRKAQDSLAEGAKTPGAKSRAPGNEQ